MACKKILYVMVMKNIEEMDWFFSFECKIRNNKNDNSNCYCFFSFK